MNGPLFNQGWIGEDASLVVALVIGIAFGFFLERAGLGSARKLAAQFYLRDLTVFKMMFTAIITAMLGVYWLNWFGILNAEMIYLTPTYYWPQISGGLLFGAGFIVGGYCPGTSCVASATGSLDGIVNVFGLLTGILIFGELYPLIENFYTAGSLGQVNMAEYFHIPAGIMVALLVSLALAGFWLSEKIEKSNHESKF